MTAYAFVKEEASFGSLSVQIKSSNRKFLEIDVLLPEPLSTFENEVRRWISKRVCRGRVSVKVEFFLENKLLYSLQPNLTLAREVKSAWDVIFDTLKIERKDSFLRQALLHRDDILLPLSQEGELEEWKNTLEKAVRCALDGLMEMKVREGAFLQEDFLRRLGKLQLLIEEIKEGATLAPTRYRQKLERAIEGLGPLSLEDPERIAKEVCIFAEKVDFTEEVVRLRSHLKQFSTIMCGEKPSVGKSLEFLLQEMLREANTITAKAQDAAISHKIIEMKSEVEKIREQVQNIE